MYGSFVCIKLNYRRLMPKLRLKISKRSTNLQGAMWDYKMSKRSWILKR